MDKFISDPSLSFEEAMKELEEIVAKLEGNDLTLDESLNLYKRGIELAAYCNKRLSDAQGIVQVLTKNLHGELQEIPFDLTSGGE